MVEQHPYKEKVDVLHCDTWFIHTKVSGETGPVVALNVIDCVEASNVDPEEQFYASLVISNVKDERCSSPVEAVSLNTTDSDMSLPNLFSSSSEGSNINMVIAAHRVCEGAASWELFSYRQYGGNHFIWQQYAAAA